MSPRVYLAVIAALVVLPSGALAQPQPDRQPDDPSRLFTHQASVRAQSGRLVRLPIPGPVLRGVVPSFADLRIHDSQMREVPYRVESARLPAVDAPRFSVQPIDIEQETMAYADTASQFRERFVVAQPERATRWTLFFASGRDSFVRQVVVRQQISEGGPVELGRGTVYRLANPLRERMFVELSPVLHAETLSNLEIEIIGEGGYLQPLFELRNDDRRIEPPTLSLPLEETSREEVDRTTVITLALPRGISADSLHVSTSSGHFVRNVTVSADPQGYGQEVIAHGQIYRVRDIEGAEELHIDLPRHDGDVFRVTIENLDSQPLEELRFEAVVRQPELVFDAPQSNLMLRFGGARTREPVYDVGSIYIDRYEELPTAELGEIEENPAFDDGPALSFAMHPGRPVDLTAFSHLTPLTVSGARDGLSHIRLPPEVLATARTDLSDLRILDSEDRQWPYLQNDTGDRVTLECEVAAPTVDDDESMYVISLPVSRATVVGIVLELDAQFVSRSFELLGLDDNGRRVELKDSDLYCDPLPGASCEPTFEVTRHRVSQLELTIQDGDDAPLEITGARIHIPRDDVFLAAPDGEYRIATGNAEAERPAYELADAADFVLTSVRAVDATVGEVSENPAHVEPPWYAGNGGKTWLLWAVLIFAVLILGFMTLRIARSPVDEGGSSSGPASSSSGPDPDPDPDDDPAPEDEPEAPEDEPEDSDSEDSQETEDSEDSEEEEPNSDSAPPDAEADPERTPDSDDGEDGKPTVF